MVTENDCFRVLAANYGKHSTDRFGPGVASVITTPNVGYWPKPGADKLAANGS